MREEWLEVSVTFDERHGYVASAPELRSPVVRSLTKRTALPDQCPHSAEADMRPPRRKSGFDPEQSLRLRRSTGIPALPTVKTACSQCGIVPH
jgi:hypothetical protein